MKCPICCTEISTGEEYCRWGPEWAHARCVAAYNLGKEDARAAVEADRAQRVPDIDYEALIHAGWKNHKYAQGTRGCVAFKHGAEWFRYVLLASTPAPAQQSGWTEESGLAIEAANRVELSCYDQGSAECMAAVQQILDGKDRGDGVANEPWESIRRRLISLVAPAPAQQEPSPIKAEHKTVTPSGTVVTRLELTDKAKESLRANVTHIPGIAQHQEPPQQERKPMTDAEIEDLCGEANRGFCIELDDYKKAVQDTERHHGIRE